MHLARRLEVARERGGDHFDHFGRDHVGSDADDTLGTDRDHRDCERVVAAQYRDVAGVADRRDAVDAAAGLFHGRHQRVLGQSRDRFDGDGGAGTSRDVVDHDRQTGLVGDGGKVTVDAFLRRLVVVGGDLQRRIRAEFGRLGGEGQRFAGGVGAGPGDDLTAAVHEFDRLFDHLDVLGDVERRRFTRGADRDHAGDFRIDLLLKQRAQRRVVHGAVAERRRQRSVNSRQIQHFPKSPCLLW